ncbi:hypothetical protein [uncultured Bradyrhizobium sp.]|uniref:hypothetical protein n=1 Tax=uncultured Bradyrhizobium sp. TaxID=199684 RepID=UPI0035C99129
MAVPALRVPLGLDTQSFEKSINDAKSLTSSTTDFLVKQFAKTQLKLVANSDQFRPAITSATKFVGDEFAKVKPQIQAFTQAATKETVEAGLKVGSVLGGPAIKGSFQAFTAVGIPAVTGLAQAMAPLALRAFAVYEALHLVSDAVGAAREQITAMVAVADKAANLTVTPQFLQLFEGESRKLKVTVDELDTALSNAFNASKEKSPIDLAKWEVAGERVNDTELALRVFNAELEKSSGKQLQGLVLFRDAQTQDEKVKAILQSMVELDKVGQHLQSLELGEKFFGAQFVDRIRQGKASAEGILDTMEKLKASQDGIFADSLVNRAKAVDDQLKLSQDRLSRSLKPTWDDLASVILTIKGYWADVVDLIAKAVEFTNKLSGSSLESLKGELAAVQDARRSGTGLGGIPRIPGADTVRSFLGQPSIDQSLRQREEDLQRKIDALEGRVFGPEKPATASRGTGAAPTLKKTASEERDPLDVAIDASRKHTATLEAEAKAIDGTAAAQARAKTVAQLEEAAKRANTAAGKEGAAISEEQRKRINAEADAVERAAAAYAKKQVESQIKFDRGTAFLSQSDVAIAQQLKGIYGSDIPAALSSTYAAAIRVNEATKEIANTISTNLTTSLVDVIDGTKTAGQAFKDFSKVVIRAIEEAIVKLLIVGPLMRGLQGGLGGIFGGISGAFGVTSGGYDAAGVSLGTGSLGGLSYPAFASGTDYAPGGWSIVGENGPELRKIGRGDQIIPNDIVRSIGGGGMNVSFAPQIDARGADVAAVSKLAQVMAQQQAEFEPRVRAIVAARGSKRW